jgi:serine/threonine protein kinase KIN1/2
MQAPGSSEKRRGMFDFYRRRNSISREGLSTPSVEAIRGHDPINAFSPLISIYYLAREKVEMERKELHPGATGVAPRPGDPMLQVTGLPSPEAAYTNTFAPEMPGEKVTGGRSRPRARTNGEDEAPGSGKATVQPQAAGASPSMDYSSKKEGTAMGLLRRFSTRRVRDKESERPQPPTLNIQPPQDSADPPRKSFSVRRTRRRDPSPTTMHSAGSQPQHEGLLSAGTGISKAKNFLGRSTSVNSADYRPRRLLHRNQPGTESPGMGPELPATSGSDHSAGSAARSGKGVELTDNPVPDTDSAAPPNKPSAARTKSLGHARQESIQARRRRWEEARKDRHAQVPEETDADLRDEADGPDTPAIPDTPSAISKPAGLKGLFSTSTTSSKPPEFIRQDIIRVLSQLGVQYSVIRGGFSCRHAPSINLDDVKDYGGPLDEQEKSGRVTSGHSRRISFGGAFRGKDREELRDEKGKRQPDQSFVTNSEGSEEYLHAGQRGDQGGRGGEMGDAGATRTRVQDDSGERLVLKFEIGIVKIPLLSLHGIQFKKVQGGMNQYRGMTSAILAALRL